MNTLICLFWEQPPEDQHNGFIISYTINCNIDGEFAFSYTTQEHVRSICTDVWSASSTISCSILASTSAGDGPSTTPLSVITEGRQFLSILSIIVRKAFILPTQTLLVLISTSFHLAQHLESIKPLLLSLMTGLLDLYLYQKLVFRFGAQAEQMFM